MDRYFYEEKQRLPAILSWAIVLVGLAMIGGVSVGIYRDVVLGHDAGAEVTKLTIVAIGLTLLLSFIVWITASFYLEIKIGHSGIDFGYFPHHRKPRHVAAEAIVSFSVRDVKWKDYFHSSLDQKLGSAGAVEVFTVAGSTVVEIELLGGERMVLGTCNKESIGWAMKKLFETQSSHG